MAIHKENDLLLAKLANPKMSVDEFEEVGLNATNTSIESEEAYTKTQAIQNMPEFQTEGVFDSTKFHKYYTDALADFNELAHDTYANELLAAVSYYKDDIFTPNLNREQEAQRLAPETTVVRLLNPDKNIFSKNYFGQISSSEKSTAEIMQENAVLLNPDEIDVEAGDFSNAKWGASINDISLQNSFLDYFKSWQNTYIQARWKEDGLHIDPISGEQVYHKKGQPKLNPSGEYYYEIANGKDVSDEQVLSRWDYLTIDGTKANTFDFMDSDDKQKSWEGTLVREVFELAPLFIPYVGGAYMFTRLSLQLSDLAATAAKMISDNNDLQWDWATSIQSFNKSLEQGTSEYSQQNTFTAENLISTVGQVGTQLLEQRALFKYLTALRAGKNINNEKVLKKLHAKYAEKYLESAGKEAQSIEELVILSNKYAESEIKALQKVSQSFGEEASRLWMTGYTVMDSYDEARANGATDFEAAMLTLGYSAMEYGILRTDIGKWILPEQKAERIHFRNMLRTLQGSSEKQSREFMDPSLKLNWAKRLFKKGANACKADYIGMPSNPLMKDIISVMASNALGEGIEETSEEFAYDIARELGNVFSLIAGNNTDFKPFENLTERYSMSFLGGMFGGAVAQADPSFLKALKFDHNMTYDHAFKEFVGMIGEGRTDDLRKMIKKLPINNQFLTKTNPDILGITMQESLGDVDDNMDKKSKDILLNMVDLCENILNKHNANISQSKLLRQGPYLKDLQTDALANSSFAAGFVKQFNQARTELLEAELKYAALTSPLLNEIKDSERTRWREDHKEELEKAEKDIKEKSDKVKSFFDGSRTPLLVRGVMKEMMPDYVKPYGVCNVELYAQALFNKSYKDLTDSEKQSALKSWEAFKNTEHQDHMAAVDAVSHGMAKIVAPLLKNIQETYLSKISEGTELDNLRQMIEVRGSAYEALSSEELLREFIEQQNAENPKNVINSADRDYKDLFYTVANKLFSKGDFKTNYSEISQERDLIRSFIKSANVKEDEVYKKVEEIVNQPQGNRTEEEYNSQIFQDIKNYIGELFISSIENKVDGIVELAKSQGFIHPEAQALILKGLNLAISRAEASLDGFNTDDITILKNKLEEQKKTVLNLPLIPILTILDEFLLGVLDNVTFNISSLIQRVEDILNTPDLGDINIDDATLKALDNALKLIDMFKALVLGATVGDVTIQNRFSLNSMINKLEEDYKIKDKSDLATIPTLTAHQILRDLAPVASKLKMLKALQLVNSGQQARIQNKVAMRGYVIMYNKFVNKILGHTLDRDKWNKNDSYDKLLKVVEDTSILKKFPDSMSAETVIEFEKQRIAFEDAIYDFMQANSDKSIEEKAALFSELNFIDTETLTLSAESDDLSDAHFMYWFMAASTVKGSSFLDQYKKAYMHHPKIAPFAALEIGVRLLYSSLVQGDTITEWVKAVRSVIVKTLDGKSPSQLQGLADSTFKYDSKIVPRFYNTVLIEGIAGSGKSTGVLLLAVAMLLENDITNHLVSKAWVAHIDTDAADKLGTDAGLKNFKQFSRQSLLDKISGNLYDLTKYPAIEGRAGIDYGDNFSFDKEEQLFIHPIPLDENIDDLPSIIIIDEVGRFTTEELKALDRFAAKHGVQVVALGDLNQTKTFAKGKASYDDKSIPINSTLYRGNFIHAPKLGETIRANNNLKQINQKIFQTYLPILIKGDTPSEKIPFRHYIDDRGFYGDEVVIIRPNRTGEFEISDDLKEKINLMFRTLGKQEKVGFAYDEETGIYGYLQSLIETGATYTDLEGNEVKYSEHLELFANGSAQGKEADYYIILPKADRYDIESYWESFYTGMTRAKKGCLEIITDKSAIEMSKDAQQLTEDGTDVSDLKTEEIEAKSVFNDIESAFVINNTLTQDNITVIANNRKSIIERVLPEEVASVKYNKRNSLNIEHTLGSENPSEVFKGEDGEEFSPNPYSANSPLQSVRPEKPESDSFELISYSHDVHAAIALTPNSAKRYDGINGLIRISPEFGTKPVEEIAVTLEKIRNAFIYDSDYTTTIGNILGFPVEKDQIKILYIKFKISETPEGPYEVGTDEKLYDIVGEGKDLKNLNPAQIGITIESGGDPLLFVPILTLPNCRSIVHSPSFLKNYSAFYNKYKEGIDAFQTLGKVAREEFLNKLNSETEDLAMVETIKALLTLYNLNPGEGPLTYKGSVDEFRKLIKPSGPYIDSHEKGRNYKIGGFETEEKKDLINSLEDFDKFVSLKISDPLISYSGTKSKDGYTLEFVEPGKPFILVTDRQEISKKDLVDEFNKQLDDIIDNLKGQPNKKITLTIKGGDLYANDIPFKDRRIKVVKIVPPKATVEAYLRNLIDKLNQVTYKSIGNDFTPFRLFISEPKLIDFAKFKDPLEIAPGKIKDPKAEFKEIIDNLKGYEDKIQQAEEKGNLKEVEDLYRKLLNYLSANNWKNKKLIDKVFVSTYSEIIDGKRSIIDDRLKDVLSLLSENIDGIYYNPRIKSSEKEGISEDIKSLASMDIDTTNTVGNRSWTVNGTLRSTAFFGDLHSVLNDFINPDSGGEEISEKAQIQNHNTEVFNKRNLPNLGKGAIDTVVKFVEGLEERIEVSQIEETLINNGYDVFILEQNGNRSIVYISEKTENPTGTRIYVDSESADISNAQYKYTENGITYILNANDGTYLAEITETPNEDEVFEVLAENPNEDKITPEEAIHNLVADLEKEVEVVKDIAGNIQLALSGCGRSRDVNKVLSNFSNDGEHLKDLLYAINKAGRLKKPYIERLEGILEETKDENLKNFINSYLNIIKQPEDSEKISCTLNKR